MTAQTGGLVKVEYLANVRGARSFPVNRTKSYRFDGAGDKIKYLTAADAEVLVKKYGKHTFKADL